jgi:hypothetical protein
MDQPKVSGTTGIRVAVMLLVSFFVLGFLSSYLYTRLRLQLAFEPFRAALKKQEEDLTSALPLVRAQLDPSGESDPTVMELSKALDAASSGIRDEAFIPLTQGLCLYYESCSISPLLLSCGPSERYRVVPSESP